MTQVMSLPLVQLPRRSVALGFIALTHVALIAAINSQISVFVIPKFREESQFVPIAPVPKVRPEREPDVGGFKPTRSAMPQPRPLPQEPVVIESPEDAPGPAPVGVIGDDYTPAPPVRIAPSQDPRHPIGKPDYPASEIRNGHEGVVTLGVCVNAGGNVADAFVKQTSGYLALDQAARKHLLDHSIRLRPGSENGVPVPMCTDLVIRFEIRK